MIFLDPSTLKKIKDLDEDNVCALFIYFLVFLFLEFPFYLGSILFISLISSKSSSKLQIKSILFSNAHAA